MSLLNDALGAAAGGGLNIGAIAAKVGLSKAQAQQVVAAIGRFAAQPGDTATQAADHAGVERSKVQQMMDMVGGEGALSKLGGMLGGLGGMSGKP